MHFILHALDKADALDRRLSVIDVHRSYAKDAGVQHGVNVLISGPLLKEGSGTMCGSFFLLEAPDKAAVEALFAQDPLVLADVWESVSISPFMMRTNNLGSPA